MTDKTLPDDDIHSNHKLLLIMDDCQPSNMYTKNPEIEKIFKNGRHYNITTILKRQKSILLPNPDNNPEIAFYNMLVTIENELIDREENPQNFFYK